MKFDLHTHTTASDGQLTPTELVTRAANMQVDVLAITDHDTISGLNQAKQAIVDQGLKLTLISGIEVSSRWHGFDVHIVGLGVDETAPAFLSGIAQQQAVRNQRAETIGNKLEKTGFVGVLEQARELAKAGEVTRAHFARALVAHHGLGSMENAFRKFLGKGKVGDVKSQWPSIAGAVELIHSGGGIAVLAHPLKYDITSKWLRRLVKEFAGHKGDAIEVTGPGISGQKQRLLVEIATQAQLKASVGSDFHAPGRWTELGRCQLGNLSILPVWHDWQDRFMAYSPPVN